MKFFNKLFDLFFRLLIDMRTDQARFVQVVDFQIRSVVSEHDFVPSISCILFSCCFLRKILIIAEQIGLAFIVFQNDYGERFELILFSKNIYVAACSIPKYNMYDSFCLLFQCFMNFLAFSATYHL